MRNLSKACISSSRESTRRNYDVTYFLLLIHDVMIVKVCFRVYDLNGDRYISKEEMFQLLKNCLVKGTEEDDDGVKDLVDLVMKKLDEDRDGRVSENDWNSAVGKDQLLLEAFGQCLPSNEVPAAIVCYQIIYFIR